MGTLKRKAKVYEKYGKAELSGISTGYKKLDDIIAERRGLALKYKELLNDIPFITLQKITGSILPNWQSYPLRFPGIKIGDQKKIMQFLLNKGIATRRGVMNAHQENGYKEANWSLPKSEHCRDQTLLLPLFPGLTTAQLHYVIETIRELKL